MKMKATITVREAVLVLRDDAIGGALTDDTLDPEEVALARRRAGIVADALATNAEDCTRCRAGQLALAVLCDVAVPDDDEEAAKHWLMAVSAVAHLWLCAHARDYDHEDADEAEAEPPN